MFGTLIKIRLNRKFESTEFETMRVNCTSTEFSWRVINIRTLTERHVITFRKQLINLLYQPAWAILVKLGEINIILISSLNKTQDFITG
jgi:hypothetical protein